MRKILINFLKITIILSFILCYCSNKSGESACKNRKSVGGWEYAVDGDHNDAVSKRYKIVREGKKEAVEFQFYLTSNREGRCASIENAQIVISAADGNVFRGEYSDKNTICQDYQKSPDDYNFKLAVYKPFNNGIEICKVEIKDLKVNYNY